MPVAIIKDYNVKITIPKPMMVNAKLIRVSVPISHPEDMPEQFTGRIYDRWMVDIDIDTGKIRGWKSGKMIVDWKVVDMGYYYLADEDDIIITEIEQAYVPKCVPEEFGDYLKFHIQDDGSIKDWHLFCTEQNIIESFWGQQ